MSKTLLSSAPLKRPFYARDPVTVAKELLGAILVRYLNGELLAGKITEVEAYLGLSDEAAHSFRGKTPRTAVLFESPGYTYVYSIHRYHCMDIVTDRVGVPGSVLLRAILPLHGLETMRKLRGKNTITGLTGGPGRLCQALGITRAENGLDITEATSVIRILPGDATPRILATPRIGVTKNAGALLRFVAA